MSFIIGPRQVGKTTLAQKWMFSKGFAKQNYLNFDQQSVRRRFSTNETFLDGLKAKRGKGVLVLDEIHKMRNWKRTIKGAFDVFRDDFFFVVTGSGRLDAFQRGGDSLAGRFDIYTLHPLTPAELHGKSPSPDISIESILEESAQATSDVSDWLQLGGFPEPFLMGSRAKMLRWWSQYTVRVTEEDMRDLTALTSVEMMRQLVSIMPSRIGNPLSINSLREDLETSFETAKRYTRNMAQLFFIFEVPAYHRKIHRAVKKEKKVYFYNHAILDDPGHRLENAVAVALNKWVSSLNERALGEAELFYLRDQDRREVDFLITLNRTPAILFEVKQSELQPSTAGLYYHRRLKIPFVQVLGTPGIKRKTEFGGIISIHHLLSTTG